MNSEAHIDGFAIPVRRSLTEPILLGGAPRNMAIVNGTLAAALGLGLGLWPLGILYWLVSHGISVTLAKHDPQFMDVSIRHIKHKGYLAC